jgi:anti-sigma B factor antagonist
LLDETTPEASMPATPRIQVTQAEGGAQVVSFADRLLFDDRTVREVSEQLNAALPNDGKPIRLILDFTGVDLISSSLLGKLILLQRRVDGTGGKLRLCELSATVHSVFKTSNLDRLFGIVRDKAAALEVM